MKTKIEKKIRFIQRLFQWTGNHAPWLGKILAIRLFFTPRTFRRNGLPDIFQSAGHFYLPFENRRLKTYTWGNYGPWVLLVHGWESRAATFKHIIPVLVDRGFRVVAFDGPAHGESTGNMTNLVEYGKAIQVVAEHFEFSGGISFMLGHSFGAGALALQISETNQFMPKKVVLVSMPTLVERIFQDFYDSFKVPLSIQSALDEYIYEKTGKNIKEFNLASRFDSLNAEEVLLVHDRFDEVVPFDHLEEILFQKPSLSLLVTENMGHNSILKNQEVIQVMVDFLDNKKVNRPKNGSALKVGPEPSLKRLSLKEKTKSEIEQSTLI